MNAFANTKVKNLSGGQKQRVAIARALANEPELILLDEPFGQIDNFKKNSLRRNIFRYLKEKNIACIVATHDKNDALSFADSLVIIRDQTIIANDDPKKIYQNPKEKYIAALFDDVNEIKINDTKYLLYPHQLKIIKDSEDIAGRIKVKATILNSYFKGSYWLIEAEFEEQTVFLNHFSNVEKLTTVSIAIH
jgi:iron(III) transport system ATP-binding protein